jgi:hypothetical protein
VVDIAGCAAIDANGPAFRIHSHALHHRQVDHQAVVAAPETRTVVTATADHEDEALLTGEIHGGDHVGDVHAPRDSQRPLVDHSVVDFARLLVVGVALPD